MGNKISLQEELINLKMTSKQMVNASKKSEKNEKKYKKDVKKAIEKGNAEGARIYARVPRPRPSAAARPLGLLRRNATRRARRRKTRFERRTRASTT